MALPSREQIVEAGSSLPSPIEVQTVTTAELTDHQHDSNVVAFLDPSDPTSILNHPIFGPSLKKQQDEIFVEKDGKKVLRQPVSRVKLDPQVGTVLYLHLTMGGNMDLNDEFSDTFEVPKIWRAVAAKIKGTVQEVTQGQEDGLSLYFDGNISRHGDFAYALMSLAHGLGNVRHKEGLYKSSSPDTVTEGVRKQLYQTVVLITDEKIIDQEASLFRKGETASRVQSIIRFLSECPANLLTCEVFTETLQQMVEKLKEGGAPLEIETYTTKEAMEKIDKDRVELNGSLEDNFPGNILQSIHAGSPDAGPFLVRVKYRPEASKGEPVRIVVGKSIMFDNGGNSNLKGGGALKMEGDGIGGNAVAAQMARMCEERVKGNLDFVFPIAVNVAGSGARNYEDILMSSSGKTTREVNTDFEGREALAEGVAIEKILLEKEGEEVDNITTVGSLSKQSAELGGHRSVFYGRSRMNLRRLEDQSDFFGESMIGTRVIAEDYKAVRDSKADFQNFPPAGRFALTRDGARSAAYIASVADLDPKITYTHFDIAPALIGGQGFPEDIKNADIPADGFLETLNEHLRS